MSKAKQPNSNMLGINMLNAIKEAAVKYHPWGFYKDENNYDLIQNDLIDSNNLSLVRKKYGLNFTSLDADIANESIIIHSEVSFALNLGFKIKFSKEMLDVFSGAFFDDALEFVSDNKKILDSINAQDIMNYICRNTNLTELIKWIVQYGNPLANEEKFGVTRYFMYSTDICSGHHIDISGISKKDSNRAFCPIFSVSVDGKYVTISCTDYDVKTGKAISRGTRIIARVLDDGTVQITSNIWDHVIELEKDIEKLTFSMHSDCYIVLFLLSNIQELLIRETIKGIPQKEYKYTIDHTPSSILRDGKIHYTKYEEHLTTNPFYPHDRKSPRLHVVSGYYKKNGTWVESYVRGTDEEVMSYVNFILQREQGDKDMSKKTLTQDQLNKLAPIIADELRKSKAKDKCKIIANKYKINQDVVRHIANTRKVGLQEFVPSNTVVDINNNDTKSTIGDTSNDSTNSTVKKVVENPIEKLEYREEEIEIEEDKYKDLVIRDSAGHITDDCKLAIAELYENGIKKVEISKKFSISITTVTQIIKDICGPIKERKKVVRLSEEDKKKVVEMYEGGMSMSDIGKEFDIHCSTVSGILKREGVDTRNMTKKRAGSKYNVNNHQYKKMLKEQEKKHLEEYESAEKEKQEKLDAIKAEVEKKEELPKAIMKKKGIIINIPKDSIMTVKEEKSTVQTTSEQVTHENNMQVDDNSICFAGSVFSDPKISTITNTVTIGMVSDRHDIGNIGYLFEGPLTNEQMLDLNWQESIVHRFINKNFKFDENGNADKYLTVYCTGIQIVLGSIVKVCLKRHVNLLLKHYNATDSEYVSQLVIDMYGDQKEIDHPFKKLEKSGKVYLYNTTLDEITNTEFYGISLNVHENDSIKFKTGDCSYIFCKSEEDAWKLYPKFVKIIQTNSGNERNSVFLTTVKSDTEKFLWGDNISKSYNFK